MKLVVLSTNKYLLKYLSDIAETVSCLTIDEVIAAISSGEYGMVVIGPPHSSWKIPDLNHNKVVLINTTDDLRNLMHEICGDNIALPEPECFLIESDDHRAGEDSKGRLKNRFNFSIAYKKGLFTRLTNSVSELKPKLPHNILSSSRNMIKDRLIKSPRERPADVSNEEGGTVPIPVDYPILQDISHRLDRIENTMTIDSLTGLQKRDYFEIWVIKQISNNNLFSLAMIDIDFFKKVNDTYGHQAGDAVLSSLGQFLKSNLRSTDIAFRYGGEEFIVALPEANLKEAYDVIDRIRKSWAEQIINAREHNIQCTFSAGVAEYVSGNSADDIIREADKALYKAKEDGRNRVCTLQGEQTQQPGQAYLKPTDPPDLPNIIWQEDIAEQYPVLNNEPIEMPVVKKPPSESAVSRKLLQFARRVSEPRELLQNLTEYKTIVLWNQDGYMKADAALEIARGRKKNSALLEFDTVNPRLDDLMKIPLPAVSGCYNKEYHEIGAGLLTFGNQMTSSLASKLVYKYRFGVNYLPSGNRLGVLDCYVMPTDNFVSLIEELKTVYETIIIDVAADLNHPGTTAALRKADVMVIPISNMTPGLKRQIEIYSDMRLPVIKYYPKVKGEKLSFI